MDDIQGKIYYILFIAAFAINGLAIVLYLWLDGFTMLDLLITFIVVTVVLFTVGRLVQDRFDNTLQLYLIIISLVFFVIIFIKQGTWDKIYCGLVATSIMAIAYFLDEYFESGE